MLKPQAILQMEMVKVEANKEKAAVVVVLELSEQLLMVQMLE